jgi:hypothetical protein
MNTLKTLIAVLFMMFVVGSTQAWAQTQNVNEEEQSESGNEESTDDYGGYGDDYGDDYGDEEVVDPYQQSVTLEGDEGSGFGTEEEGTMELDSKPATKIHIYSGKHDGDNVINSDPKR